MSPRVCRPLFSGERLSAIWSKYQQAIATLPSREAVPRVDSADNSQVQGQEKALQIVMNQDQGLRGFAEYRPSTPLMAAAQLHLS